VAFERLAGVDDVLRRVAELSARTVIFDVEPLVAYWDSGQDALDRGIALVAGQAAAVAGVRVVCFATNSLRRPSMVPAGGNVQVVYLTAARKPLRVAPYREFPRPGVVIGDQLATDGVLARRLGYVFLQYRPRLDHPPAGPRLMYQCGRLVRPLLFTRPG
jgi:predicted HAD superfamily phosphohydrolase YqeG